MSKKNDDNKFSLGNPLFFLMLMDEEDEPSVGSCGGFSTILLIIIIGFVVFHLLTK